MSGFVNPLTTTTGFQRAVRDTMRDMLKSASRADMLMLMLLVEQRIANQMAYDASGARDSLDSMRADALLDVLGASDNT